MMEDASLTSSRIDYVKDLLKLEHKLKKVIDKDTTIQIEQDTEDETGIDNRLMDTWNEFESYTTYKETYKHSGLSSDVEMAHQELGHFLNNIIDIFRELADISVDSDEEKIMIKSKVKEIYSMFN